MTATYSTTRDDATQWNFVFIFI